MRVRCPPMQPTGTCPVHGTALHVPQVLGRLTALISFQQRLIFPMFAALVVRSGLQDKHNGKTQGTHTLHQAEGSIGMSLLQVHHDLARVQKMEAGKQLW